MSPLLIALCVAVFLLALFATGSFVGRFLKRSGRNDPPPKDGPEIKTNFGRKLP